VELAQNTQNKIILNLTQAWFIHIKVATSLAVFFTTQFLLPAFVFYIAMSSSSSSSSIPNTTHLFMYRELHTKPFTYQSIFHAVTITFLH